MNKSELTSTVGVLANFGVLIGIVLLVAELRQNQALMRAQTRNNIAETAISLGFEQATSSELLAVQLKATSGEVLTELENLRWRVFQTSEWRYRENVYYQYRNGLFDEVEYLAQREAWRRIVNSPPVRVFWCGRTDVQSPYFVSEINQLLENPCD